MVEISYNKRAEDRLSLLCGTVNYSTNGDSKEMPFIGITINVSNSGVAIFTHQELAQGAIIKMSGKKLWDGVKYARIMWCDRVGSDIYRAGLSFVYSGENNS